MITALSSGPALSSAPVTAASWARSSAAIINVYFDGGDSFDAVRFFESPQGGGYESDNHTVGYFVTKGGVPEPATWAMLITGFGLVGAAARRRRSDVVTA